MADWVTSVKTMGKWYAENIHVYSQSGLVDCPILGKKIRRDCSGYVTACLQYYGLLKEYSWPPSSIGYSSGKDVAKNLTEGGFEKIPFSWDTVKPYDIMAGNGHTEIFNGTVNGKRTSWTWGICHDESNGGLPSGTANSWNKGKGHYSVIWRNTSYNGTDYNGTDNDPCPSTCNTNIVDLANYTPNGEMKKYNFTKEQIECFYKIPRQTGASDRSHNGKFKDAKLFSRTLFNVLLDKGVNPMLALTMTAQKAIESAWGGSRFAEHNNLGGVMWSHRSSVDYPIEGKDADGHTNAGYKNLGRYVDDWFLCCIDKNFTGATNAKDPNQYFDVLMGNNPNGYWYAAKGNYTYGYDCMKCIPTVLGYLDTTCK